MDSTIVRNASRYGGGVANQNGSASMGNSIVADNSARSGTSPDYFNTLKSLGYNLIENTANTIISGVTTGFENGVRRNFYPFVVGSCKKDINDFLA